MNSDSLVIAVAILAATNLLLLIFVLVSLVRIPRMIRQISQDKRGFEGYTATSSSSGGSRVAVVVNPTKVADLTLFKRTVSRTCAELGVGYPMWLETTARDPGFGQARQAVSQGAELVLAAGGDGTVRAVADALSGTKTALGLVPMGTGNLLARNIGIPLSSVTHAVETALEGKSRPLDMGHMEVIRRDDTVQEHPFLVMAGVGFDASIMMDTSDELKSRFGWVAYVMSGLRKLRGRRSQVSIAVDERASTKRDIRTVLIGNCGGLPGGVNLMPNAQIDDGILDVLALAPRGLASWLAMAGEVMNPRSRHSTGLVERSTGENIQITMERPMPVQVDGDLVGTCKSVSARVQKHALLVRVPN